MAKEDTADSAMAKALERFAEIQLQIAQAAQKTSLSPEQLEVILGKVGLTSAHAMQKALKPENEQSPLMSVFNPAGDRDHPKAPLSRKTYLNGHPEHSSDTSLYAEMLTQPEIDKYNALGEAVKNAPGQRLEARNGLYKAELRNRGSELHIEVPVANLDTRTNLPPTLIMLCHEIETGESMMDLNALLSEVTRLRAEVEKLGGHKAQPARGYTDTPPTITAKGGPLVKDLEAALEQTPTAALAGAK